MYTVFQIIFEINLRKAKVHNEVSGIKFSEFESVGALDYGVDIRIASTFSKNYRPQRPHTPLSARPVSRFTSSEKPPTRPSENSVWGRLGRLRMILMRNFFMNRHTYVCKR